MGRAWLFLAVTLAALGCSGRPVTPRPDGAADAPVETIQVCAHSDGTRAANGSACGCDADCQTGFCVDGLCCDSACTDTCKSCKVPGSPGVCTFVPAGEPPRSASTCPASEASTCGLDGTCDGSGGCRKFVLGTICQPGTCSGASVTNANVCDGAGRCKPGPATICAPFNCDSASGTCVSVCHSDSDCVDGHSCVNGSCGPKPRAAVCTTDAECASGFCTDGVCCNVACKGACVSCNQTGREGTCWPIDAGRADPHGICHDQGASTCQMTGACDGIGGCALYAAEAVCRAPVCSGDQVDTTGTCDGVGTCRPPGVQPCSPFHCSGGACINRCTSDADCVAGHSCVNGSCGPKSLGQSCAANGDCGSGFCVDGVCCDSACQGACRSCALSSTMGHCTSVAAGAQDPRRSCADQGAASCGTDGTCDGAGACRKYRSGTVCAPEHCTTGVYTGPSMCNATGACAAPAALACAPYVCNGSKCFTGCTVDGNCSTGNVCVANSCGKKPNGASCSGGTECGSGICAQGICCATACTGACKSCALAGSLGTCTNVPSGSPDPAQVCTDQGASSCGNNGKCAAGACQKYAQGTPCGTASCPAGGASYSPAPTCDGAGTCVSPAVRPCYPFRCGTAGTCATSCTADADCVAPAVCVNGSCGLKGNGAPCAAANECSSGICAQGVCCATTCTASCRSCALAGSAGTCSPIPAGGLDPSGTCKDQGAATCGTTGLCNGSGGCQLYAAGVTCAGATCPAGSSTGTLARTCDGAGVCRAATPLTCSPYACNGTGCNAACVTNTDCASSYFCNLGACTKKSLGQTCTAATDCASGFCTNGVCCGVASCGTCMSCNAAVLTAGTCQLVAAGTSCAADSCPGSTSTKTTSACNAAGQCVATTTNCFPFACDPSVNACRTSCNGNGMCASGASCVLSLCVPISLTDGGTGG
jgi:hypothetical protein